MTTAIANYRNGAIWEDADKYLRGERHSRGQYFVPEIAGWISSQASSGNGMLCGSRGQRQGASSPPTAGHDADGYLIIPTAAAAFSYQNFAWGLMDSGPPIFPFRPRENWTIRIGIRCKVSHPGVGTSQFAFGLVTGGASGGGAPADFYSTPTVDDICILLDDDTTYPKARLTAASSSETITQAVGEISSTEMRDFGIVLRGLTDCIVVAHNASWRNDAVTKVRNATPVGLMPAIISRTLDGTVSTLTIERLAITAVPD